MTEPDRPGYQYEVWPGETDPCEGLRTKLAAAREGFRVIAASASSSTLSRKRASQIRDRAEREIGNLDAPDG